MQFKNISSTDISLLHRDDDVSISTTNTLNNEVNETDYPITTFKVFQKIISTDSSSDLAIGGFLKGDASFNKLKYKYLVVLFSDKFDTITNGDEEILMRYGYGLGITLTVTDVNANLNVGFGSFSAASKMDYANINYRVEGYGITDAKILEFLPNLAGEFNFEAYTAIIQCITDMKNYIANNNDIIKLKGIEQLATKTIGPEESETRSFYRAALLVAERKSFKEAIEFVRRKTAYKENEKIISYMYQYFGLRDAFSQPNLTQAKNANRWIRGTYKKYEDASPDRVWIAVEPEMDKGGHLMALRHLGDDYKPHKLWEDWQDRGFGLYDDNTKVSIQNSSELKVAAIADISGSMDSQTIVREVAIYWDVYNDEPLGKIIMTRYAVGVRLKLKVTNIEFGTEVSFGTVAAAARLGQVNVEYEIRGIGISDKGLLKALPEPQDINEQTLAEIEKSFSSILQKIQDSDKATLNPQPIAIMVQDVEEVDPTISHQAAIYAYINIEKRNRLNDVLESASQSLDPDIIKKIYQEEIGINGNDKPSFANRRTAADWLSMEG